MFERNTTVSGRDISRRFSEIRNINTQFTSKYKVIIEYLKVMNSQENYEKEHIVDTSLIRGKLGNNKDLSSLFDSLGYNTTNLINTFTEFIQIREEENKKISDFFSKNTDIEFVDTFKQLKQILVNYNEKKQELNGKLSAILPKLITESNEVIGIEDIILEDSAKNYSKFLKDLVQIIQTGHESDKGSLFNNFILTLIYLNKYKGDVTLLQKIEVDSFIGSINNVEFASFAKCFATRYKQRGDSFVNEILNHIDKDKVQNNDYYSAVKEDEKGEKFDKKIKSWLEIMLSSCKYKKKELETKEKWNKQIEEIFKVKSDMKDLNKRFDSQIITLQKILFKTNDKSKASELKDYYYLDDETDKKPITDIEKFKLNLFGTLKTISEIKDFKKETDENNLKQAIKIIDGYINNSKQRKDEFIYYNAEDSYGPVIKKRGNTGSSSTYDDDFDCGTTETEGDSRNIVTILDEIIIKIKTITGVDIENQYLNEDKTIKEESKSDFYDFLNSIAKDIKILTCMTMRLGEADKFKSEIKYFKDFYEMLILIAKGEKDFQISYILSFSPWIDEFKIKLNK